MTDEHENPYRWKIISERHVGQPFWPDKDKGAIEAAHKRHDLGTHTLAQRRVGGLVQLVEMEYRTPDKYARPWFSKERIR